MKIKTSIFLNRIREREAFAAVKVRRAAVKAIADTMAETIRFGSFDRSYIEEIAEARLEQALITMSFDN